MKHTNNSLSHDTTYDYLSVHIPSDGSKTEDRFHLLVRGLNRRSLCITKGGL